MLRPWWSKLDGEDQNQADRFADPSSSQPGEILTGLGLGKMHRVVELEDTPEVRGMIRKLPHMVEVLEG